jgi:hypothetical protein
MIPAPVFHLDPSGVRCHLGRCGAWGRHELGGGVGGDGANSGGSRCGAEVAAEVAQEIGPHVLGGLVAGSGVLLHGFGHDHLEFRRNIGIDSAHAHRPFGYMLIGNGHGALTGEGRLSAEQFVEHHSQRVDIRSLVCGDTLGLFGTEVGSGTDDRAGPRQLLRVVQGPCYAEVGHFHGAVGREHDVAGFDVPMEHSG